MRIQSNNQTPNKEEVCISGVAGKFPESIDIEEYATSLLKGIDEESNWSSQTSNTCPQSISEPRDINFFGIESSQLTNLNMVSKNLVECVYDAIFDSGVNPAMLGNTQTGVFVGTCTSDQASRKSEGLMNLSNSRSNKYHQLANDVCTALRFKGPIRVVPNECCSSIVCLDLAIKALKANQCNQAIVCGIDMNSSNTPMTISCIFLQRKTECKRIYATLLASKISTQQNFQTTLDQMYTENNVNPSQVLYVENYCDKANKQTEVNQLQNSLRPVNADRRLPLYMGSRIVQDVLPQMTGMSAIAKMIVAIQRQVLPASQASPIKVLSGGRAGQEILNNIPMDQNGLMVLNASCDMDNIHVIMRPQSIQDSPSVWTQSLQKIPTLFTTGARTSQNLQSILEKVKQHPTDLAAQILLLDIITTQDQKVDRTFRGFCVLNSEQPDQEIQEIKQVPQDRKPIYYVFNGITTEWQEICQELMHIEAFNQSIQKSALCLKQYQFDLVKVLDQGKQDKKPLESVVAITAMQMALVDCLSHAGIKADGLIGHSIGELACAYADGALTGQECIQAAYQRGKCIQEANFPKCAMAVVGLSWEEAQKKCPASVVPSSNNEAKNVTISGPADAVQQFIQQLRTEGIPAKPIDSSHLALCSQFMTSIAPQMNRALEQVITNPKQRTSKWISTSIPEKRWKSDLATTASARYLVNSLCSHVYFKEALAKVPSNALVINIGPSNVLDEIVQNNIAKEAVLMKSMAPTLNIAYPQITLFWQNIGKLYIEGAQEQPMNMLIPNSMSNQKLYPVPVNTGFISDIAKLTYLTQEMVHSRTRRSIPDQQSMIKLKQFIIDINTPKDRYLSGHKINDICVLPVSSLICMAWETLAEMNNVSVIEDLPIQINDLECNELIRLDSNSSPVRLTVQINQSTDCFQIMKMGRGGVVCSGRIRPLSGRQMVSGKMMKQSMISMVGQMAKDKMEIYQQLKQCGHDLRGQFKTLVSMNANCTCAEIEWTPGHWVALLDGMMQMNVLQHKQAHSELRIKSIQINPDQLMSTRIEMSEPEIWTQHQDQQRSHDESFEVISHEQTGQQHPIKNAMRKLQNKNQTRISLPLRQPVVMNPNTNTVSCPGVLITGITCGLTAQHGLNRSQMEFVSYIQNDLWKRIDRAGSMAEHSCTVDKGTRAMVNAYFNDCKQMTQVILARMRSQIPQQIQSNNIQGKALDVLTEAAMLPSDMSGQLYLNAVRDLFFDNIHLFKAIQQDDIINSLPYDCNLKDIVDTVLENVHCGQNRRLRVLEISSSFSHCYVMKLDQMMKDNYPDCQIDYQFASIMNNPNQQRILSYLNEKLAFRVNKVNWQLLSDNGELNMNIPSLLQDFDLVLFNTSLQVLASHCQSVSDLQEWMQQCMRQMVQPEGFLMVHEFTRNSQSIADLCLLEQVVCEGRSRTHLDMVHVHKLRSESEWRQIIESIDLIPVSIKNDQVLSTVSLYRGECHISSSGIEYLDIDNQGWINQCQQLMQSPDVKRVLLISDSMPDEQILNQILRLREVRGGRKLRCLFATDNQAINVNCLLASLECQQTVQMDQLSMNNEWLLKQVIKADLFMNIFRNGKWGSLHTVQQRQRPDLNLITRSRNIGLSSIPAMKWRSLYQEPLMMHHLHIATCPQVSGTSDIRQLMPSQSIVKLNQISMVNHQVPVVIIHPIEGHVSMLKTLAQAIKFPVYGVQYTKQAMICESIEQLADQYWDEIQAEIGTNNRVHLCGYGLGAIVALEMASLNANKCASITLLDSGKPCMEREFQQKLSNMRYSEDNGSDALFTFATQYIRDVNKSELMQKLMDCNNLVEKIRLVVGELMNKSQFKFNEVDLADAALSYVMKCQLLAEYMSVKGRRIRAEVILIKPNRNLTELDDLLCRMMKEGVISKNMIEKHLVGCDMRNLLDGENCRNVAAIINENLVRCA